MKWKRMCRNKMRWDNRIVTCFFHFRYICVLLSPIDEVINQQREVDAPVVWVEWCSIGCILRASTAATLMKWNDFPPTVRV